MSDRYETYVYESPDGGDTIFRRRPGETGRELVRTGSRWELLQRQKLWGDILRSAENDAALQEMLDQIEVYYHLKNSPQDR
jgi:hypothetical protein